MKNQIAEAHRSSRLIFTFCIVLTLSIINLLQAGTKDASSGSRSRNTRSIVYVDNAATGSNNGSNWTNAHTSLNAALTAAVSGDEIWVAQGVYYPAGTSFMLKNGVEVYGGFAGTETARSERDWQLHNTILSGDIDHNDVNADGNFIAETWADIVGTNVSHVVVADGLDATSRLDGFVITAGSQDDGWYGGGAILNVTGSPSYYNLKVLGNQGIYYGGGLLNISSSPHVENVLFEGNRARSTSEGYGGGMYSLYADCSPSLVHVVFNNNQAFMGGGLGADGGSSYLEDVTFSNNTVTGQGYGGGAYFHDDSTPTLNNVTFTGNHAYLGGGLYAFRGGTQTLNNVSFISNFAHGSDILNCGGGLAVYGNITVTATNVSFIGNWAADSGGGAYIYDGSTLNLQNGIFRGNRGSNVIGGGVYLEGSQASFKGVTFNGNRTYFGGGSIAGINSTATVTNSILWGNLPDETYTHNSTINISYSDVQQGSGVYSGSGNINIDPMFVLPVNPAQASTTTGDSRLLGSSLCINAGNNSTNTQTYDIRGNLRIQNTTIDMGAYEWTSGTDPDYLVNVTFTDGASFVPVPINGRSDQPLGRFSLQTDALTCAFNTVSVNLSGSFSGLSNFKLWESTDASFDSLQDTMISSLAGVTGPMTINFNSLGRTLSNTPKHLFLTCDIEPSADGNLSATIASNASLAFHNGILNTTIANAQLSSAALSFVAHGIFVSPSALPDFGTVNTQTDSGIQSYTVSARGLSADLAISVSGGFMLSLTGEAGSFGYELNLTPVGGVISPTTVYVLFHPWMPLPYTGVITHSSLDVESQFVMLYGTGTTTLTPPENLRITFEEGNIILRWNDVMNTLGYKVFASDTPDGTFTMVGTTMFPMWVDTMVTDRKYYKVVASTE